MNETQVLALRTALLAENNAEIVELKAARDTDGIATWYNQSTNPAFYVWRKTLSRHEILTGISDEGTTFAWAAGAYITRSQGERDAFREMFNSTGNVDPSLASIKAAFNDIFSGAGGAGNRAHILAMSRRVVSRGERIFSTGTGTKADPGVCTLADQPLVVGEFDVRRAFYNDDGTVAV